MNWPGVAIGVSTVADGNMSFAWGEEKDVIANRQKFFTKVGLNLENSVFTKLQHGNNVEVVGKVNTGKIVEVDGLITTEKDINLFIVTADCLPVVYHDPTKSILGLAHLGWKGVDKDLAEIMVGKMVDLGSNPADIHVWIGPGVRKESYWKYGQGIDAFKQSVNLDKWTDFLEEKPNNKLALDLVGLVKRQLAGKGVNEKKIEVSTVDTVEDTNYFSQYRSYNTHEHQGRFATVVQMV